MLCPGDSAKWAYCDFARMFGKIREPQTLKGHQVQIVTVCFQCQVAETYLTGLGFRLW